VKIPLEKYAKNLISFRKYEIRSKCTAKRKSRLK